MPLQAKNCAVEFTNVFFEISASVRYVFRQRNAIFSTAVTRKKKRELWLNLTHFAALVSAFFSCVRKGILHISHLCSRYLRYLKTNLIQLSCYYNGWKCLFYSSNNEQIFLIEKNDKFYSIISSGLKYKAKDKVALQYKARRFDCCQGVNMYK